MRVHVMSQGIIDIYTISAHRCCVVVFGDSIIWPIDDVFNTEVQSSDQVPFVSYSQSVVY